MSITTRILKTEPYYIIIIIIIFIIIINTEVFFLQYKVLNKVIRNKYASLFFIYMQIHIISSNNNFLELLLKNTIKLKNRLEKTL